MLTSHLLLKKYSNAARFEWAGISEGFSSDPSHCSNINKLVPKLNKTRAAKQLRQRMLPHSVPKRLAAVTDLKAVPGWLAQSWHQICFHPPSVKYILTFILELQNILVSSQP
ncbi:hypothetical protein CEXT_152241 [Caerostris extrusa]|uniref:Uncharacterized protein n=1 Tax=Caerostris extrusa TaxID=172846 RepID=A0AAV4P5B4_CAEEX|nr:hypothetical protein CEXT_152241 [Caerostris extrusa]